MQRLQIRHIWLSSLLLASVPCLASAQGSEVTHDTADAVPSASAQRDGRNWFVSLMRRVGRRSGDSLITASLGAPSSGDTSTTMGGDSTGAVPESALPARTIERNFK